MAEAATSNETGRWTPHFWQPAGASPRAIAGRSAGRLHLAPYHRPALPPESCTLPDLGPPEAAIIRADHASAARLLFLSDDPGLLPERLRRAFPAPAHEMNVAGTVDAALEHLRTESPHVIVLDLSRSGPSWLEAYQRIRSIHAHLPVIVVVEANRADAAIEPIKHGAYDCLFRPLDLALLRRVVGKALEVARRMHRPAVSEGGQTDPEAASAIIGSCPAMADAYKAIGRVAAQDVPVLITGESGTGKELAARAIHEHGPRVQGPFLALNCAAIPEALLESELFGHEKGAFTGATQQRLGKFEQASGGTLFLDEVGDMPLALQAKILRLLQDQTFERVGGNETIHTNVRLIAATHRDLKTWSADGKFRPDLYYRLAVFTIHMPPLRERGDDLPLLVRHYLRRFSRDLGREVSEVAPEALEWLRGHAWPGNVRELQSVLKQALLRAHGTILLPDFLPDFGRTPGEPAAGLTPPEGRLDVEAFFRQRLSPDSRDLYSEIHRELDRLMLPSVLAYTGGNQHRAALMLGTARQTLRAKLRDLRLRPAHAAAADEADVHDHPQYST